MPRQSFYIYALGLGVVTAGERGSFEPTVNSFCVQKLLILLAASVGFESATVGCHCDLCDPQFESKIANDDFVISYVLKHGRQFGRVWPYSYISCPIFPPHGPGR